MRPRGQFQFTVVELFVLALSFAATSAMVFLLGFYVGREVAGEHGPPDQRVARLPIEEDLPIALAAKAKVKPPSVESTGLLGRAGVAAPERAAQAPAEAARPEARAEAAKAKAAPAEPPDRSIASLRQTAEAQPPAERARAFGARVDAPQPRRPADDGRTGTFILTDDSLEGGSAPASAQLLASRADRPAQAPRAATPAYTVQVLSTRDRAAADNLVRSLKSRGYGAYLKPAEDSTGRWYRVRIGRFDELASARSLAARCRRDLRLDQAYVISD